MKTLLKIVAVVMILFTSSIAFVDDEDPDPNDDVFSAIDAMGFYYGRESMCSESALGALSYDTIKSKIKKVHCGSIICLIQLETKVREVIGPGDPEHPFAPRYRDLDVTFINGIICPEVLHKFDISSLENEMIGKKVRIKGPVRKYGSKYINTHDISIFVRSPEDIEVIE